MVNGKRGDDPLTDILRYGDLVFDPEIDGLVREVDELNGWDSIFARSHLGYWRDMLEERRREHGDEEVAAVLPNLRFLLERELERLRSAAS